MNFYKTKFLEILINNLNIENDHEVFENTLGIIILLLDKYVFIKLFIILLLNELINLLKIIKNEIISKFYILIIYYLKMKII